MFLEKIELRFVPEEAGFVDREIFEQLRKFVLAFGTDQQPVIGVEGVDAALLQPPQETIPYGRWADTLTTLYTDYQMNTFIFWPSGDRERQSQIFAGEVVPAVRAALAGTS